MFDALGNGKVSKDDLKVADELRRIAPGLKRAINRENARLNGSKNTNEFLKKKMEEERFRAFKVNEWFDAKMKELSPRLFFMARRLKTPWMFKMMGWRFNAADREEEHNFRKMPCVVCTIRRVRPFCLTPGIRAGVRMFWRDK